MIKKPIAIFSEDFPPCSGGIAQWAMGVAQELSAQYVPIFIYTKKKSVPDISIYDSAPFHLIRMHGHDWKKYRSIYSGYYGWKFLSRYSDSIIISTTWGLSNGLYRLKKKYRFKLVTIAHGLEVTRKSRVKVVRAMERTLSNSDYCVAVSHFTKNRILERISVDPSKITVIPNGIHPDRFYPDADTSNLRQKLGLKEDTKILLTLARIVERKGHDMVIRSLPQILKVFPNMVYIIAGHPRDWVFEGLKRLIDELNVKDYVLFTGMVDSADLVRYYNLADVYIMVSRELEETGDTEGFGITFLEANGCAKPVIGSFSGGIPDAIMDGKTGFLVDPLDIDAIANRVIQLFSNPELASKMGKNGRQRIQQELTWKHITQRIIQLFEA